MSLDESVVVQYNMVPRALQTDVVVSGSNHEVSMTFAASVTCRTTVLCSALLTLHNANDVCRQSADAPDCHRERNPCLKHDGPGKACIAASVAVNTNNLPGIGLLTCMST